MVEAKATTLEWSVASLKINLGYQYISNTLNSLNIEPGKYCLDHTKKMDHKAKQDNERKTNPNYKCRRAQLHNQKIKNDGNKKLKKAKLTKVTLDLTLIQTVQVVRWHTKLMSTLK